MNTQVMNVTPEMAQKWLGHNSGNRHLRETRVRALVTDMQNGNWRLTHQGIAFDEDGNLLDGQHRLMAVVKSGITVPMLVTTDMSRDTILNLDTGVTRDVSDILKFRYGDERIYRKESVAVIRFIWQFTNTSHLAMTTAQVEKAIQKNEDLLGYILMVRNKSKSLRNTALVAGLIAGLTWGIDNGTIERFVDLAYRNTIDPEATRETNRVVLDYARAVQRVGNGSIADRRRTNEMTRCALYSYVKGMKQARRLNIEVPYPIRFDDEFRIVRGPAVYAKTYAEDEVKSA